VLGYEDLDGMAREAAVEVGVAGAGTGAGPAQFAERGARCVQTVRDALRDELVERGIEGHASPAWFFPTVAQYALILDQAGLFVRTALWFERPTRLEGSGALATWLELFCLPLLHALGDRRAEVVAGVERRCHAQLYRDGAWWLDYTRLRVVAVKP
jgi:hypothetical protein